ncbi:MAG: DUF4167 domain-containing protein [Rhodobacteraceae bacterium]|nr:MAG: DUF4167 domain-containing protein [Paracoccaceae bacterium]
MRSPNKRSRSKANRPKSLGNIVNRVFDSSGPEGKVRGTPQQIIEKYQVLARDAQLANDRVAAENFQQHSEHYTRLLAQAQREQQAEQEARRQQQEERNRQQEDRHNNQRRQNDQRRQHDEAPQHAPHDPGTHTGDNSFAVQGNGPESEPSLVETPESRSEAPAAEEQAQPEAKPANRRKPRAPRAEAAATGDVAEEKPAKPRRAPRKPRSKAAPADSTPSASAAE